MMKKIKDIVFRKDLYPRFEPNQNLIRKYSESIEYLPPIIVDQHDILIDGFHRLKAHELVKETEIKTETIEVESEKELKMLAYKYNSNHGFQLDDKEKKKYAREMVEEYSIKELAKILSVSGQSIRNWTEDIRTAMKEERDRKILIEYLRGWNTQDSIAEEMKISRKTIGNIVENLGKNQKILKITQKFTPLIYNIWNAQKGNNTQHFGSFPKIFMDNLLYYHTEPFDVVYDPFSGNGTTIDSCKGMYRRYYCADRQMKPGREDDMVERSIQDGYPDDLQKPKLVFLDPPYWKQAAGKYSDSEDDLANMELDGFYSVFETFLRELMKRKIECIVIVIQPTQFKNDFIFEDHVFKFDRMLNEKYEIEMRYILPYSTQQYNAQMVTKAKELKKCLALNRDLIIWRLK